MKCVKQSELEKIIKDDSLTCYMMNLINILPTYHIEIE